MKTGHKTPSLGLGVESCKLAVQLCLSLCVRVCVCVFVCVYVRGDGCGCGCGWAGLHLSWDRSRVEVACRGGD